ncbi:MAG TPA: DUF1801 domain-containing protein [Ktedonobacterales bacterium]|jgi:uncharacterized protein YdhG (YjbR/CyaY superfamily)
MGDDDKQTAKASTGFTSEEKSAMRQRAKEQKAAATRAEEESAALAAIAAMSGSDRAMAERLHAIITANVPALAPKTWYGMPAYANEDGKIICFFQPAAKFKTRYATFGFNDSAHLDEGGMWPVAFALTELTAADEARITALVTNAVN